MLELKDISRNYGAFSLENINLRVPDSAYFVLLGPSGAGKTQILEIIAGLVRPDQGTLFADSIEVTHAEARHRPVGIVFQDLAVFPHLTIAKNISYGLRGSNLSSAEIHEKVHEQAIRLNIGHLLSRRPGSLSGGELQRVALARTLIRKPRYLLLDEPLASLDVQLRQEMFGLLRKLHHEGQAIIHVTHDYEETLVLATHVAVVNQGRIVQSGPADEVFHRPGSEFVARFTGIKNYFPACLDTSSGPGKVKLPGGQEIMIISSEKDGDGFVLIPGEEIILSKERLESSAVNQWKGIISEFITIPGGVEVVVDAGVPVYVKITRESLENLQLEQGKDVWLSFKASGVRFISVEC
jgi:molybdopterin-binding protein